MSARNVCDWPWTPWLGLGRARAWGIPARGPPAAGTFAHLARLTQYGEQFESLQEQFFLTTGPFGDMLIALFACMAKIERERISERTKAGVARARAQGKKCGRPIKVFRRDEALRLSREGKSGHEIGRLLQVSVPAPGRDSARGHPVSGAAWRADPFTLGGELQRRIARRRTVRIVVLLVPGAQLVESDMRFRRAA
jgi:hypothetical protein